VRDRFSAARCIGGHWAWYQAVSARVLPQTPALRRFSIASMKPSRNNALVVAETARG
jgi:hypothetical protein